MKRFLWPLILFFLLVVVLAIGLRLDPKEVPSPLIGKPIPAFRLTQLHDAHKTVASGDMLGQVWVLNVWASWCVSCRQEHPVLLDLVKQSGIVIVGLNYKDHRSDALRWLEELGNPYQVSAFDENGRIGIDLGVYGVPETFVMDKRGLIRFKHTGPIQPDVLTQEVRTLMKE